MSNTNNVVVTGGRDYPDSSMVWAVLTSIKMDKLYVGDAKGADLFAKECAEYHGIPVEVFKADWTKHGKAAGPIRNATMLDAAGKDAIVVAFLGGKGTANCVNEALRRNMIILKVIE